MIKTICICGAGTMGSGIAQVAARSGFETILYDVNATVLDKAKQFIEKNFQYLTDSKKISEEKKATNLTRLHFTRNIEDCYADLIIEAIAEIEEAKISLFNNLITNNSAATIFATNTSSLSVSFIQKQVIAPERMAGMHFFNPAYAMKLVEVIKGVHTNSYAIDEIYNVCLQM